MTARAAIVHRVDGVVSIEEFEVSDRAFLAGAYQELPPRGESAVVWKYGCGDGVSYRRVGGKWLLLAL